MYHREEKKYLLRSKKNDKRCNNRIVIRYATGNDSYFLSKQVSLFYPKVYGSTIYSDSTELACLSRLIRQRILSRQIVI